MDFFGIGPLELLVIGVVALLVLGPDQLPQIANKAGKMLFQARNTIAEARDSILLDVDVAAKKKKLAAEDSKQVTAQEPVSHTPAAVPAQAEVAAPSPAAVKPSASPAAVKQSDTPEATAPKPPEPAERRPSE